MESFERLSSFAVGPKRYNKVLHNIPFARYSDSDQEAAGIADFFADGNVGNIAGKFLEREIHLLLDECGYKQFYHESQSSQQSKFFSVSFEEMNMKNVQKSSLIGEMDALVSGNAESFQRLCDLSEVKFIPQHIQPPTTHTHILAIEAKLSSSTLIKAMNGKEDPTKIWWLMQPQYHSFAYRAVILNGGEATKAFIVNGGVSSDNDTKMAWEKLSHAGIMMFYVPSFSFEWGHEMLKQNREIKQENLEIKQENREIKQENREIKQENLEIKQENREIKQENREIKQENREIIDRLEQMANAIRKLGGNMD